MTSSDSFKNDQRPSSSDRTALNYGYRLYQKGIKKKEEHDRECREAKKEREIREKQSYTFKPTIDPNSKEILRDTNRDKPENRLLLIGQVMQERKEQQRTVGLIEDKLKCTFHPEVNKKYNNNATFIGAKKSPTNEARICQWTWERSRQVCC